MIRLDATFRAALVGIEAQSSLKKLEKASQGVEQLFVKQLLSQMRKMAPTPGGDSYGMEMYRDMMDDALAESISKRGGFGISKQLEDMMKPALVREAFARFEKAQELASSKSKVNHEN